MTQPKQTETLGQRIRRLRQAQYLSLRGLKGVSSSTLQRIENDTDCNLSAIVRIAYALGKTPGALIAGCNYDHFLGDDEPTE